MKAAADITFNMTDRVSGKDTKTSIVEYYKTMYKIDIKKPRLPCITVSW